MPLIGIVDPSHYEREHDRAGRYPNWFSLDELLGKSAEGNPKWSNWTFELVNAALHEHQERGTRLSTSALTAACPRATVLERTEPYITSLDSMYAPLRGTLIHRTLENNVRMGGIAEARFYTEVDEVELSCSPDLLTEESLYDYKVTENPPAYEYPYRHHTEQVMFNAFIARHLTKYDLPEGMTALPFDPRDYPVKRVVVVYLGPKGPKILEYRRKEEFVTPAGVTKEAKVPYVWDDEETLDIMRPRLHMLKKALAIYPEWPEGAEEVWGGAPGYRCPGPPLCNLPKCLAARYPDNLTWERPEDGRR